MLYTLLVVALFLPSYGLFGGRSSSVKSTKSTSSVVDVEDPFKAENKRLLTTIETHRSIITQQKKTILDLKKERELKESKLLKQINDIKGLYSSDIEKINYQLRDSHEKEKSKALSELKEKLEAEYSKLIAEIKEESRAKIEELNRLIAKLEKENDSFLKEINTLKEEVSSAGSKYSEYAQKNQELEKIVASLRKELGDAIEALRLITKSEPEIHDLPGDSQRPGIFAATNVRPVKRAAKSSYSIV